MNFSIRADDIDIHWLGHFYPEIKELARDGRVFIDELINYELFFEVFPLVLLAENLLAINKVLIALNIYLDFWFDLDFNIEPEIDVISLGFVNFSAEKLESLPIDIANNSITVLANKAFGRIMGVHIPYLRRQPDKQVRFKEAFLALMDDMQKSGNFASNIYPFSLPVRKEWLNFYQKYQEIN